MKRIVSLFAAISLLLTMTVIAFADGNTLEFAGGTGTETDPYLVATKEHLDNVRNYLDAHFKMIADIELSDTWVPIGTKEYPFSGVFNGDGFGISNLQITTSNLKYFGLFGYSLGVIKNLVLASGTVNRHSSVYNSLNPYVGSVVAYNGGTVSQCVNFSNINLHYNSTGYMGGIVAYNAGNISKCINNGVVDAECGTVYVGGVCGYNEGDITLSYNTGMVYGYRSYVYVGGVLGYNVANADLTFCYNIGNVKIGTGGSTKCGSIYGKNDGNAQCNYGDFDSTKTSMYPYDREYMVNTELMKDPDTYVGFDFETVWYIDTESDYPYPQLLNKSVDSISIWTHPQVLNAIQNEAVLDFTGAELWVHYDDDSTKIVPIKESMVTGFDNTKTGRQTLTVTYAGKQAYFDVYIWLYVSQYNILIEEPYIGDVIPQNFYLDVDVVPSNASNQVELFCNWLVSDDGINFRLSEENEKFNVGKTYAIYNGAGDLCGINEETVRLINNQEFQLTSILWDGYECEVLYVSGPLIERLKGISIETLPIKTEYLEAKDSLDVFGGRVALHYENAPSKTIELRADMISGFDNTKVGVQSLKVTYGGKTTQFDVHIKQKSISSIFVTRMPSKTVYLEGDIFSIDGIVITAYYDNGTSEEINDYTVSGYDSTSGDKVIKVCYGGKETSFLVTVVAKALTSIELTKAPNKTTYFKGESLDLSGLTLLAKYNNNTEEVIESGYTVSGNTNSIGIQTITLTYNGKTVSFDVTVIANNPFVDVKTGAYYYDPVLWAVEKEITTGTTATTFSPEEFCTRGQIVTFLWRAAGSPEPTSTVMPFTDVSANAYYYKAVLWAVEKGITTGTTATTFSPEDYCTRGQIVTFLWRSQGKPAAAFSNPFGDVKNGAYYYTSVLWAVENGITNGTSANAFSPEDTCTRAQCVTFLYRCYN